MIIAKHGRYQQRGLVAPALPIARMPKGRPAGVWTMERSEPMPLSAFDCTGSAAWVATMPADGAPRWHRRRSP